MIPKPALGHSAAEDARERAFRPEGGSRFSGKIMLKQIG
jgi:hypothetical protein